MISPTPASIRFPPTLTQSPDGRRRPSGFSFDGVDRMQIVACGTAYLAGLTAKYLFEKLAGLPVDVEIASEFRYRSPALGAKAPLALAISQSGETADTLAALKWCKAKGLKDGRSWSTPISRPWPGKPTFSCRPTLGPEIGVASTKAFTAQVCALSALAIAAARQRETIDAAEEARLTAVLMEAPRLIGVGLGGRSQGQGDRLQPLQGPRRALPRTRPDLRPGPGGGV